jgi:hypothetical protein
MRIKALKKKNEPHFTQPSESSVSSSEVIYTQPAVSMPKFTQANIANMIKELKA